MQSSHYTGRCQPEMTVNSLSSKALSMFTTRYLDTKETGPACLPLYHLSKASICF